MSRKAIRKESITEVVNGDHYLLDWVIEGTRKLTHHIVFKDGALKGRTKADSADYLPGQENIMRAMISQIIREALRDPT